MDLFEQYVLDGLTYRYLAKRYHVSIQTLSRKFHSILDQDPPPLSLVQPTPDDLFLLFDGLWFGKRTVCMIYREARQKCILRITFMAKEYGSLIAKDIRVLEEQEGHQFTGYVSDGGSGCKNAISRLHPYAPHQICLAHTHRLATAALGKRPKDNRVKQLKALADHVWLIESQEALAWWVAAVANWYRANWEFMLERRWDKDGSWWFVHKGVRKAHSMLVAAPKTSFTFLRYPTMPRTTNAVEATIGVLEDKERIHRGLRRDRSPRFIKWFVYFYNKQILTQSKKKTA